MNKEIKRFIEKIDLLEHKIIKQEILINYLACKSSKKTIWFKAINDRENPKYFALNVCFVDDLNQCIQNIDLGIRFNYSIGEPVKNTCHVQESLSLSSVKCHIEKNDKDCFIVKCIVYDNSNLNKSNKLKLIESSYILYDKRKCKITCCSEKILNNLMKKDKRV